MNPCLINAPNYSPVAQRPLRFALQHWFPETGILPQSSSARTESRSPDSLQQSVPDIVRHGSFGQASQSARLTRLQRKPEA
jgi:hypothetical protein